MKILRKQGHRIALFGVGLIGSAIRIHLHRRGFSELQTLPINWSIPHSDLRVAIQALMDCSDAPNNRLSIIWSAGACGFGSTVEQTEGEHIAFSQLLQTIEDNLLAAFRMTPGNASIQFHLVSSAGALFEGQRSVTSTHQPASCRPYADLKLAQEHAARQIFSDSQLSVYRPTSVYGHIRVGHRIGLVSALIKNSIERRVTHLVGRTHSLRDYVCADDIGGFIATNVTAVQPTSGPMLLAQGKPSSVFEIQKTVENILRQRAYISYNLQMDNDRDTTFAPSAHLPGWRPQPLDCGIRGIADVFRSTHGRLPVRL